MSKNVLQYKGYLAKVEYDSERGLLYGTVQGIRDAVGRRISQPYGGQFSVRIGHELHQGMAEWALNHDMTLNQAVKLAVQEFLAQKEQA